MKKNLSLSALFFLSQLSFSQVPKKVVVEHFTNTRCSICASKNPGFYTNLNSQTGVIHLAVHPSAPYSNCILNQHNVAENDGRTNYYGIYGGTPRLVIQGTVISSSANYSSPSIFTPYLGQTSPASIKIIQSKYGNDSIRSRIVIKTEAAHSLGSLKLFVALAEDTIFYVSPNGETLHFDVFRKSLTGFTGMTVNLPAMVGDSIVYAMSSAANVSWDFSRVYTLAILQDATTKAVVQSESAPPSANNAGTNILNPPCRDEAIRVYSFQSTIYIKTANTSEDLDFILYDASGRMHTRKGVAGANAYIQLANVSRGSYLYEIRSNGAIIKAGKLVLE